MTTSLTKDAQLANFAALAYKSDGKINGEVPAGWAQIGANIESPFAAFAYKNLSTGEIVIAYRGTDGISDAPADAAIAAGQWTTQYDQGAQFAKSIFDANPGSTIFATGHSLGGAIAQVVECKMGMQNGVRSCIATLKAK